MKAFELVRPTTLAQAFAELASEGAARGAVRALAGGQDLLTEMKDSLAEPDKLVDLKRLAGLDRIEVTGDGALEVGALVKLSALAKHLDVRRAFTALGDAARSVGSAQIRSQGTVGGNLNQRPRCWYYRNAHAPCLKKGGKECFAYSGLNKYNAILGGGPSYIVHPSDLATALVALGAEVTLESAKGSRRVPLAEYYTLPAESDVTRETVLSPGEILTRVRVPALAGWQSTYLKFRERGSFDFALAAVAVAVRAESGQRRIAEARLVLGGVAPKPWSVPKAAEKLVGLDGPERWAAAAKAAVAGAEPLEHNAYKVPLGRVPKTARGCWT
jgi:xanthine dehydrogenase YagS FAD-binding subunit